MRAIEYLVGDATRPLTGGNRIIVHVCNDIGGWGKGFVMALSRRWKMPEKQYREWHKSRDGFVLGAVQFVQVEPDLWVANLIGQHKIRKDKHGNPPIRYDAIAKGLSVVAKKALTLNASVHMPRIGCGLAGGEWSNIEPLIEQNLIDSGIKTIVYDLGP